MKLAGIIANNSSLHLNRLAEDFELAGEIQTRLSQLGCLDPPADGQFGPVSTLVLHEFAKAARVPFDDAIDSRLAQALLDQTAAGLFPLELGNDFASRIVKYMQLKNYWLARLPGFLNLVYVEGANKDGSLNDDAFNKFNDRRLVLTIEAGKPTLVFNVLATTEPGKFYTENPLNPGGAARIAFGQYKAWVVGLHNIGKPNRHEALVQKGRLPVHRDKNKDGKRTGDFIDVGDSFGINQHSGFNASPDNIGKASAGCLVGQNHEEHKQFMALVKTDPRFKKASRAYVFMTTVIAGDDLKRLVG